MTSWSAKTPFPVPNPARRRPVQGIKVDPGFSPINFSVAHFPWYPVQDMESRSPAPETGVTGPANRARMRMPGPELGGTLLEAAEIDSLYRRYGPMVLRRCRRLLGNEDA